MFISSAVITRLKSYNKLTDILLYKAVKFVFMKLESKTSERSFYFLSQGKSFEDAPFAFVFPSFF